MRTVAIAAIAGPFLLDLSLAFGVRLSRRKPSYHDVVPVQHTTLLTASTTSALHASILDNLFANVKPNASRQQQRQLKDRLLVMCTQSIPVDRLQVENIIDDLRKYSPITATASAPQLQKKWDLVWTTEKEINLFVDRGWSNAISQTIDGSLLTNSIPFVMDGEFCVTGRLTVPDPHGVRTNFVFDSATLRLGEWSLPLPPIGKGWFDTVYLDDDLRVDINSRNDILICNAASG